MPCPVCAAEQPADVATLRLNVLSQTIGDLLRRMDGLARRCARLEGELADLRAEHETLRRCAIDLEHGRISGQAAHNALVAQVEETAALLLRIEERTR